jgi:hypothetical protein
MVLMSLEHSPARTHKDAAHDDEVLSFKEWCRLNNFSESTGLRILKGPKAKRPQVVQLSAHRIGITRGENRRWQQNRSR